MKDTVRITVMGDICPSWGYSDLFKTGDPSVIFGDILDCIGDTDYLVANLESPVTLNDNKLSKNSVCLKANPAELSVIKKAGIDAMAIANNHILDYGVSGLEDTVRYLQENNIEFYGAGDIEEAVKPLIKEIKGMKIAFLAFAEREFNCPIDYQKGANLWDDLSSIDLIRHVRKQCDFLIVQYHGGIEHYRYPSPCLRKKCRAMAEAGANFITCQHSHCIGTHENWHGAEILYGQGNSIFGYEKGDNLWNNGLIAQIDITDGFRTKYIPITATVKGERLLNQSEADELIADFEKESDKIFSDEFIKTQWDQFCDTQRDAYLPMLFCYGRINNKINRVTRGFLIEIFTRYKNRRNTMNLIRCDAHREVIQTILEKDIYHE